MADSPRPVLLITGGASGIGAASARRMARSCQVVIADADLIAAQALAGEICAAGDTASAVGVDVADARSVAAMMAEITAQFGTVAQMFTCAGINLRQPVAEIDAASWDRMLAVHLKGSYLCARAVLPGMCAARSGAIVTMSSDFAIIGVIGSAAYAAAKSAIYSFTKSLAREFAPFNIRVNALGPGPIDTPLLRRGRSEAEWQAAHQRSVAGVPMRRLGQPEEVAAVLDYLLGPQASFITGQIIHPNGGQVSW